MERKATLMNLSPWQAWIHLYCQEPDEDCSVTFACNGMSGEPVTWNVTVSPKIIFSYWPNKMVDGRNANLQAALMEAGKTEEEARRRTTCEVFSDDETAVRGYTLFSGQPTLNSCGGILNGTNLTSARSTIFVRALESAWLNTPSSYKLSDPSGFQRSAVRGIRLFKWRPHCQVSAFDSGSQWSEHCDSPILWGARFVR